MLRSLKDLEHYEVSANDGDIGSVLNFLIDDERWIVRYLVVQAGGPLFLNGRRVLISPVSFGKPDWPAQRFHVALTMDKVRNSPSIDLDKPVSRRQEQHHSRYYGYPSYWGLPGLWGTGTYPAMLAAHTAATDADTPVEDAAASSGDVHLRSDEEVRGYDVHGSDGAIGHIEDFVVDDETWEVCYLVVNTRSWWFGKHVLVAPRWASNISWVDSKVDVDLSRQAIKDCPEWDAAAPISREYETRLHDHYGRRAYWVDGTRSPAALPPVSTAEASPGRDAERPIL